MITIDQMDIPTPKLMTKRKGLKQWLGLLTGRRLDSDRSGCNPSQLSPNSDHLRDPYSPRLSWLDRAWRCLTNWIDQNQNQE